MRFLNRFPSPSTPITATRLFFVHYNTHFYSHLRPQKPNATLKGYVKSNATSKALLFFRSLWRKDVSSIDSFSLLHILKACTRKSYAIEGKQIHGLIMSLGFGQVIFLQTTLINVYSAIQNLDDAHRMFDEIPFRNAICWTALISAYVDNRKPKTGLMLFRQMQMENVAPDQVTITVALSGCADLGALDMGEWIHAYISHKRGFQTDLCLNNALINMYAKCGDIGTARRLFDRLSQRDVTTWTSMIVGYAVHGQAEEALRLFAEMIDKNKNVTKKKTDADHVCGAVLPNQVTFIGVLMACSHAGRVEEGRQHLESMSKNYGLRPQISHYGCMVDLLCRAGLLQEAYAFIMDMPIQPNAVVWRTLLGACSLQGNIELGENVRLRLHELDPTHVGDNIAMSNTYAAAGMWDEKFMVRDQIKHRRAPGCSSIEVRSEVHEFVAADNSHPLRQQIYEVLESMIKSIKAIGSAPNISTSANNGKIGLSV